MAPLTLAIAVLFFLIGYETHNRCKIVTKSCHVAMCITSLEAHVDVLFIGKVVIKWSYRSP